MKRIIILSSVACLVIALACGFAFAEDVVVGPTLEKSVFKPEVPAPPVFERDFVARLKTLGQHPGVVETSFITKPLYDMCRKPRVISYAEADLMDGELIDYDCFVFFDGDVERLRSRRNDMELLQHRDMKFYIPRDSALVILNGRFKDNVSAPVEPEEMKACDRCSTDEDSKLSTCKLMDEPLNPLCHGIRYEDLNVTIVWGLTYQRSLAVCNHYAEGAPVSVSGDVCYIKATGGGKINANCRTRFGIEATNPEKNTIFISGPADGFIRMTNEDMVYAGEGVNLIFVDNSSAPAERGKVVTTAEENPCLRIIAAEQGF